MTLSRFIRRLHLYLGLALLPWLLMYGVSAVPFAHAPYFQKRDEAKGLPLWSVRERRPLDRPVPEDPAVLRDFARDLLDDLGVRAPNFGTYRPNPRTLHILAYSFFRSERVVLSLDQSEIRVERRRFRLDQVLTGMHARGGFRQDGWWERSWGVVVDFVALALLVWVVTGLWLWWESRSARAWGALTLALGVLAFTVFAAGL